MAKAKIDNKAQTQADGRAAPIPSWVYGGHFSVQRGEGNMVRWGNRTLETMDNIKRSLNPAMAERLARQGISMVVLHATQGAGLKADLPNILANKPLSRALKEKGLRRVAYVESIGFVFREILMLEKPEAENWLSRKPDGLAPYWYDTWFWPIPCLNNAEFIEYIKNLFRRVMKELDLDGLFLDCYAYYNYSCFCEHCQRRFREYLYKRYPTEESRLNRFEMPEFTYITPPPFDRLVGGYYDNNKFDDPHKMIDPVTQEWIRFRCERMGEITAEFNACVKEKNPEAILYLNYMYGGAPGMNNSLFHGIWPEFVYPHADLILAEVSGPPSINDGGVLSGRAILMKITKHFGVPMSTCTFHMAPKDFKRVYLAEGLAFNEAPFDLLGDINHEDPTDWMLEYQAFYRARRDLIGHAPTVADCAVLHNFESMSFACIRPQESVTLCEQSLLQGGVTFDIIFDKDLDRFEQYPCLFLPNVYCMSSELIARVAAYIRAGGSVVATEDTACYNEQFLPWRGTWPGNMLKIPMLAEALGIEWPKSGTLTRKMGKGRIAVLAAIGRPWNAALAPGAPGGPPIDLAYHSYGPQMPGVLRLPALSQQHREILDAVDYALDGKRAVRVRAQGPVISEVTRNAKATFVHLLNWDETNPQKEIEVSLLAPRRAVKSVKLISPDKETAERSLEFTLSEGRVQVIVPSLLAYDILVVK